MHTDDETSKTHARRRIKTGMSRVLSGASVNAPTQNSYYEPHVTRRKTDQIPISFLILAIE